MEHEARETRAAGRFPRPPRVTAGRRGTGRAGARLPRGRGDARQPSPLRPLRLPPRTHKAGNMATTTQTSSSQLAARLGDGGQRRPRLGGQANAANFPRRARPERRFSAGGREHVPPPGHGDAAEEKLLNCRRRPGRSFSLKTPGTKSPGLHNPHREEIYSPSDRSSMHSNVISNWKGL